MSFHRFNPFTGRLSQVTQSQALSPLKPQQLEKAVPIMIYDSIETKPLQVSSGKRYQSTLSPRMEKLYKHYQADLSKPVFLLGGARDKLFYRMSVALTAMSFMLNMYLFTKLQKKF